MCGRVSAVVGVVCDVSAETDIMTGLPGGYLAVAIHYYGSSNTNARLVILDLNAIAATAPQSSTASSSSSSSSSSTRRRTTDEGGSSATTMTTTTTTTRTGPAQSRITRRRERLPSPSSNSSRGESRSRSGSSEGDASGDDANAYEDGEDEEDGDKQRERRWSVEEEEEGDGSTWRLVQGTKDVKVNSMVVLPDGRLVGATSDGCIFVWSFDTKSR